MAMPAANTEWTVEMLDELSDDGNRYEIIDGALFVTPAPTDVHQLVVGTLHSRLRAYLRPTPVARAIVSPSDVRREPRRKNRVQPDVFAVKLRENGRPPYPFDLTDLLLAVEVVSPGHARYDFQTKRELYLAGGVPEYWVIDVDARAFTRWCGSADPGELLAERIEWQPSGVNSALVIELDEFFEDALG